MSARLIELLLQLSRRERLLLAALAGAVLPLALAFALLLPLAGRRSAAETALAEAVALQGWAEARAAEKAALVPSAAAAAAPAGLSGLEQGLIAAGLRPALGELGTGPGGVIELSFEAVDFQNLAGWLSASHPGWGYAIQSFRFEAAAEPGRVAAWITLAPAGS